MEADEEARLCREHEQAPAFDDDLETDENSDWLRGCGWPPWFQHKPIPILLTAASLPAEGCPRDLFLGRWNELDCISPAASERTSQLLVAASRQVLSRCQETLKGRRAFCGVGCEAGRILSRPTRSSPRASLRSGGIVGSGSLVYAISRGCICSRGDCESPPHTSAALY